MTGIANDCPSAVVLYQFFPPDEVVSATLFGELSAGLVQGGWDATAYPSIYGFGDASPRHVPREDWNGVHVRRVWRPRMRQGSNLGRILNSLWMVMRWSLLALDRRIRPDVLIVGTDPVLSILVAPVWKFCKPRTRVVHWCFDLYPEAAIADGTLAAGSLLVKILQRLLRIAYCSCDLIVDIGPCMRQKLAAFESPARKLTVVPWALEEHSAPVPVDQIERNTHFGNVPLALMYSGTFGRAHQCELFVKIAQKLDPEEASLVFSASGSRLEQLQRSAKGIANIRFCQPSPLSGLLRRLSSADVHLVSLKDEWTGTVVPSKFFGALAVGRPVLFSGSPQSAIARWIEEWGLGWVVTSENLDEIVDSLRAYSVDVDARCRMNQHCFDFYNMHWCRRSALSEWDAELRSILGVPEGCPNARR